MADEVTQTAADIADAFNQDRYGVAPPQFDSLAGEHAPAPVVSGAGSEREVPAASPARGHLVSEFVFRHDDGSECLWGVTDQKWYRMHPLYPTRECDREHVTTPANEGGQSDA